MKVKIIYYSQEGNTKLIATQISKLFDSDVLELKPIKEYPTKGFLKYFWGGKSIVAKEKPQLEQYDKAIEDYDLIILGSPIWAGTFAPPIRTFLTENDLVGKRIAFFVCHAGGGESRCFKDFSSIQPNCDLVSTISLLDPAKSKNIKEIDRAILWAKKLQNGGN
jgi:flavodoxin